MPAQPASSSGSGTGASPRAGPAEDSGSGAGAGSDSPAGTRAEARAVAGAGSGAGSEPPPGPASPGTYHAPGSPTLSMGPASPAPASAEATEGAEAGVSTPPASARREGRRLTASLRKRQRRRVCYRNRPPPPGETPSPNTDQEFALAYSAVSDQSELLEKWGRQTDTEEEALVACSSVGRGHGGRGRGGGRAGNKRRRRGTPKEAARNGAGAGSRRRFVGREPSLVPSEGQRPDTAAEAGQEAPIGAVCLGTGAGGADDTPPPGGSGDFGANWAGEEQVALFGADAQPIETAGGHLPALPAASGGGNSEGSAEAETTSRLIFQAERRAIRTTLVIDEFEEAGLFVTRVIWKAYR